MERSECYSNGMGVALVYRKGGENDIPATRERCCGHA